LLHHIKLTHQVYCLCSCLLATEVHLSEELWWSRKFYLWPIKSS